MTTDTIDIGNLEERVRDCEHWQRREVADLILLRLGWIVRCRRRPEKLYNKEDRYWHSGAITPDRSCVHCSTGPNLLCDPMDIFHRDLNLPPELIKSAMQAGAAAMLAADPEADLSELRRIMTRAVALHVARWLDSNPHYPPGVSAGREILPGETYNGIY